MKRPVVLCVLALVLTVVLVTTGSIARVAAHEGAGLLYGPRDLGGGYRISVTNLHTTGYVEGWPEGTPHWSAQVLKQRTDQADHEQAAKYHIVQHFNGTATCWYVWESESGRTMDWCVPDLSRLYDLFHKLFEDVLEVIDSKMIAVAIAVVVVAVVTVVAVPLVTSAVLFGATRVVVRSVFGFGRATFGFGRARAIAR